MEDKELIQDDINDLKEELEELQERAKELENCENEDEYDQMLDDCHEGVFNILPSTILKECDPIAYRCGHTEYNDEPLSILEDEIQEKEQEIKDLEDELKEVA